MTWEFHVDNSTENRYGMKLGRYIQTCLVLKLKRPKDFIKRGDGPFERRTSSMVDLGMYEFTFFEGKTKLHL